MYETPPPVLKDSDTVYASRVQAKDEESRDTCVVTFGSVVHIELDDIPRLLSFIRTLPNSRIIYTMKGLGNVRLVRE